MILNEDQLTQINAGTRVWSDPVYYNGHWVKSFIDRWKAEGEEGTNAFSLVFFVLWTENIFLHYSVSGLTMGQQESRAVKYTFEIMNAVRIGKVGDAPERKLFYE